jgi:hypothetical protein
VRLRGVRKESGTSKKTAACLGPPFLFRGCCLPAGFAPAIAATATTTAGTSATAATAKAIAAATAESTAATLAGLARTSFVYGQGTATHVGTVEGFHSLIGLGVISHFHECETTGLARVAILYDLYPVHLSIGGKRGIKILLGGLERDVPDVDILQSETPFLVLPLRVLLLAAAGHGLLPICGAGWIPRELISAKRWDRAGKISNHIGHVLAVVSW